MPAPSAIGFDEFQLAIPWRVGLHQIPLPLHQPAAGCSTLDLPVEHFSANGKHGLIRLSQRRGPPQSGHRSHAGCMTLLGCLSGEAPDRGFDHTAFFRNGN